MNLFCLFNLVSLGDDLAKHDNTVAVEERNTGETLTGLEGVDDEGLARCVDNLGHLVGLEGVGVLGLLATSLLADLPLEGGDTAGGAAATDETDGGVADLDLTGDIQNLDLGGEVLAILQGGVLLVDHDVTSLGHVLLDQTLDVKTDVVTGNSLVMLLVMHLDGKDLTGARVGGGVGGQEDNFGFLLDDTLLDTAGQDITDTLNLVDTGDGHAHLGVAVTDGETGHVIQHIQQSLDVDLLGGLVFLDALDVHTLPPAHVLGLLDQVVTSPAGDGHDGDGFLDEVLLPADLGKHVLHLVGDLGVTFLGVLGDIAIHLVDANGKLLHTQQIQQTGVLTGLALDLTGLVVTLLDGGNEVAISGNHQQSDIGLGGAGNHVLDKITMAGGIDDGVVPLLGEELLGGASNGDTTLTLLLLAIHKERKGERGFTETVGLILELLHGTLIDTAELEDQMTSGGGLAGVDVTADHDGHMGFTFGSHDCC